MSMMLLGAGPSVASGGGGGAGVQFVDAMDGTFGNSVSTLSQSGAAGVNPSGSNRAVFGAIHTLEFGSQATHNDMDIGSTSLDSVAIYASILSGFDTLSVWQAVAPSTGAQTASGDWSASQFAAQIGMVAYSGVHQTTPLGSVATANNFFTTTSGTVSVTVPSTTIGRKVIAFCAIRDGNAGPVSPAATTGTTVRYNAGSDSSPNLFIYERTADSTSTVMDLNVTVPIADGVEWYVAAAEIIPAA